MVKEELMVFDDLNQINRHVFELIRTDLCFWWLFKLTEG